MQESHPEGDGDTTAAADDAVTVPVADGVTARLPPTADADEAAAIVAAIATHLRAEADEEPDEEPEVDRWKLSARLGSRKRGRFTPQQSDNAWKLAGRTRRL